MELHLLHASTMEDVSKFLPSTRPNAVCSRHQEVIVNMFSDLYVAVCRFSPAEEDTVATSGRGGVVPHLRSVLVPLRQMNFWRYLCGIKPFWVMLLQRKGTGFLGHLLPRAGNGLPHLNMPVAK